MSEPLKHKILIVDDMPANIKILGETLRSHYTIMVAASGKKALQIMASDSPPDLVITDLIMPEMDGYQLVEAIREMEKGKDSRVPIIGITASLGGGTREKCLDAGMDECLHKSVDAGGLLQIIEKFLEEDPAKQDITLKQDSKTPLKGEATFNMESLRNKLGHDEKKIRDILQWVLEDMGRQILLMENGIKDGLMEQTRDAAHRSKGSAIQMEAVELTEIFKNIETLAEDGKLDMAQGHVNNAKAGFEKIRVYVEQKI